MSIIGTDRMQGGYGIAKVAHEQATLSGPISARALRAAQFHEFVEQLLQWGTHGDVSHVPEMRTQLVASRTVAEALAELAVDPTRRRGRRSRSRARVRRASSRWRSSSSPGAATRYGSRP